MGKMKSKNNLNDRRDNKTSGMSMKSQQIPTIAIESSINNNNNSNIINNNNKKSTPKHP